MSMAGATEEIRCPSCSRPLVLRSGPAITPHFAHRPRQSCRIRPGRPPITHLHLEQLTLFELEASPAPGDPLVLLEAGLTYPPGDPILARTRPRRPKRCRRRAWLPRLIRWVQRRRVVRGPAPSSAFTPETRGDAGPRT